MTAAAPATTPRLSTACTRSARRPPAWADLGMTYTIRYSSTAYHIDGRSGCSALTRSGHRMKVATHSADDPTEYRTDDLAKALLVARRLNELNPDGRKLCQLCEDSAVAELEAWAAQQVAQEQATKYEETGHLILGVLVFIAVLMWIFGAFDGGEDDPTAAPAEPASEPAYVEPDVRVPYVVGKSVEDAEDRLEDADLWNIQTEPAHKYRHCVMDGDEWKVTKQHPAAGKHVDPDTEVTLTAVPLKPEDACEEPEPGPETYSVPDVDVDLNPDDHVNLPDGALTGGYCARKRWC